MNDNVGSVLHVNFIQGEDYVQEAAISAARAAQSAVEAKTSETNAKASELAAANSEANAATSEANAANSEVNAINAEQQAHGYANAAFGYAGAAENSAVNAANSADQATAQASNVGILVTQAENIVAALDAYSVPKWNSTTVYSYPQVVAYTDGQTYRCIGTNVPAGTIPPTSLEWVRLTVLGGDDFFDVDMYGSLMPAVNPTFAYSWQLDEQGNIMPRAASDTLGTEINTYAEQTLQTANEALARANTIIYEGIPVELDSAGNVTTTSDTL
jgi:hypothetical protein